MPELPEVETVCRGLQKTIAGKKITRIETRRAGLRTPFPSGLQKISGVKITHIARRAKYVLMHLDNRETLILHLGMSGRLMIEDKGQKCTPQKHDHVIFHMADGSRVIFNDARRFGVLDKTETALIERHRLFAHLGLEPLEKNFTAKELLHRLSGRKTDIKIAVMDQRIVVGVGNIYAAEALFLSRIHPKRPAGSLTATEAKDLVRAIRLVLNQAIRAGGSSLRDYVQTDGELGYFQHRFSVYGRAGEKCKNCRKKNAIIEKVTQGGRTTFYCPACQK